MSRDFLPKTLEYRCPKVNEQVFAVQRMQEYIEKHLSEKITIADLSGTFMFSPWHLPRVYKTVFEKPNIHRHCEVESRH